jgi:hypothetical protein
MPSKIVGIVFAYDRNARTSARLRMEGIEIMIMAAAERAAAVGTA